jgi:hypothetical protein
MMVRDVNDSDYMIELDDEIAEKLAVGETMSDTELTKLTNHLLVANLLFVRAFNAFNNRMREAQRPTIEKVRMKKEADHLGAFR